MMQWIRLVLAFLITCIRRPREAMTLVRAWFATPRPRAAVQWLRLGFIAFFAFALAGFYLFAIVVALTSCSTSAQSAKTQVEVQKAEADMCRLRTDYKLANAAVGGALSPPPGSPRALLEQAEDNVCAARTLALATAADAG